jgi:hypothetical protein
MSWNRNNVQGKTRSTLEIIELGLMITIRLNVYAYVQWAALKVKPAYNQACEFLGER